MNEAEANAIKVVLKQTCMWCEKWSPNRPLCDAENKDHQTDLYVM